MDSALARSPASSFDATTSRWKAAYRVRLQARGYRALRHELALLEALRHRFVAENDLARPDALAVAIDATAQITALNERQARLERQLTPVSPDDLQRFLRGVDQGVARLVAPAVS